MIRRWEVFHSAPHAKHELVPRVSLSPRGVIAVNRKAIELLDEPEAVELLFDRFTNCIGLRPISLKHEHAFRLNSKGRGRGRLIRAKRFCNYYAIRLERTVVFNRVEKSAEGILQLDLMNVTEFVREKMDTQKAV